jgi:serine/threonine protein phosphatase PrpC
MIEVAKACRWVKGKGHDRALAVKVAGYEDVYLVAIADGLTSENGGEAAQWAVSALERIAGEGLRGDFSARRVFERLSKSLDAAVAQRSFPNSHTTLTCGLVSLVRNENVAALRFDFFAVGDSPVWKVLPTKTEGLTFQGFIVYNGPVPGEQGHVYSTVNLGRGSIDGVVYFGSVDVETGEVLILASDGVPDARVFWDDQDPKRNKLSPRLALRLLDPSPMLDETLAKLITEYDAKHLLIDDDASLVVVRTKSEPLQERGSPFPQTEAEGVEFSTPAIFQDEPAQVSAREDLRQPSAHSNVAADRPDASAITGSAMGEVTPGLVREPPIEGAEVMPPAMQDVEPLTDTTVVNPSSIDSESADAGSLTARTPAEKLDSPKVPTGEPGNQSETLEPTDV